jgi:spore coat polysaccharide biosynthesis predicted glycosyltransferase SpsG
MKTLFGPQFALLRPEFAEIRHALPPINSRFSKAPTQGILSLGGSDPTGVALNIIQWIRACPQAQALHWHIIEGPCNPHSATLRHLARGMNSYQIVHTEPKMAQRMAACDVMIAAGGTTTWERLCLGVPSLVVSIADNQTALSNALSPLGVQHYIGLCPSTSFIEPSELRTSGLKTSGLRTPDDDATFWGGFTESFLALSQNAELRQSMATNAMALVDGLGANRVAQRLQTGLE